MNISEAKEIIKQNYEAFLEPARKKGYICPVCGNGSGTNGTGIEINPKAGEPVRFRCFVCETSGDIIEFMQKATGRSFSETVQAMAAELHLNIDTPEDQSQKPAQDAQQWRTAKTAKPAEDLQRSGKTREQGLLRGLRFLVHL